MEEKEEEDYQRRSLFRIVHARGAIPEEQEVEFGREHCLVRRYAQGGAEEIHSLLTVMNLKPREANRNAHA